MRYVLAKFALTEESPFLLLTKVELGLRNTPFESARSTVDDGHERDKTTSLGVSVDRKKQICKPDFFILL